MPAHHQKPIVRTACPANRHTSLGERIVEFSFPAAAPGDGSVPGGLICFRNRDVGPDTRPIVEVYRTEGTVRVVAAEQPVYAVYASSPKTEGNIELHRTYRAAILSLLAAVNYRDELILNDQKIDAMDDDELMDAVGDYAVARGFVYRIEALLI